MQTSLQGLENSINKPQNDPNWNLRSNYGASQIAANNTDPFNQFANRNQNTSKILESVNQSQFSNSILKQMPFGTYFQPRNIQGKFFQNFYILKNFYILIILENTSRALEMSMNALALNRMLATSNRFPNSNQPQNLLLTNRFGGYGTLAENLSDSTQQQMGSLWAPGPRMSNISSNLFDVPDDEEEDDALIQGFGHH